MLQRSNDQAFMVHPDLCLREGAERCRSKDWERAQGKAFAKKNEGTELHLMVDISHISLFICHDVFVYFDILQEASRS